MDPFQWKSGCLYNRPTFYQTCPTTLERHIKFPEHRHDQVTQLYGYVIANAIAEKD